MFWFFVMTNFLLHFFYLSVPGIILCFLGIWRKPCLYLGAAVQALDLILSFIEQMRIRKAVAAQSDNPEFNELMDASCEPGGMEAVGRVLEEKKKGKAYPEEKE